MGGKERRSKKRSAASSKSKQLEPLVFFLDRSLGKEIIATALRAAGADVRIHDDLFAQDARDQDWLPEVGTKGMDCLDQGQSYQASTRRADGTFASGSSRIRSRLWEHYGIRDGHDIRQGSTKNEEVRGKALPSFHRESPPGWLH